MEIQLHSQRRKINKELKETAHSIERELAQIQEEEKEVDAQLSSFPSLEQPLKLTNCLEIYAPDSLIKTLVGGTKSKASLVTQLAPKLANLTSNYESQYVAKIYSENQAKREEFAASHLLPSAPTQAAAIQLEPESPVERGLRPTPREKQLLQNLFYYDFNRSAEQEQNLLHERVKMFRSLPGIVSHLQEKMASQRAEEKKKVDQYTTEYCEWRRVLKKQQKQIEEQEVKRYGQQAFTQFLTLSDKAGSDGPRYRQLYSNQASSKRSFYCPVKHAKNVVGQLPRTGLRRTLGSADVVYQDNMESRREKQPMAAFQSALRSELWSLMEIEQFLKSYMVHGKDFFRIASSLKSKELSQVIKFYYLFKQKLKLKLYAMEFHSLENASSKQKLNLLEEIVARIKSQLDPSFLDEDRLNFLREHMRFTTTEVNTFSLQDLIHMLRKANK